MTPEHDQDIKLDDWRLIVPCRGCGARKGELCFIPAVGVFTHPHWSRAAAAIAARQDNAKP